MESARETKVALASAATLVAVPRWILGGAKRRCFAQRQRVASPASAWSHVEARQPDTPQSGRADARLR